VSDVILVEEGRIRRWTAAMFEAVDVSPRDAELVSDNLVTADLRGVFSHGVLRVPTYVERIRAGLVAAGGRPSIVRESGATALVDGDNALGPVAAGLAMEVAIARARELGTSTVGVRHSNHFGTCAHYAMMASAQGLIGICATVSGTNIMAPWGGIDRMLGNNPLAVAVPARRHPDVVLDIAMSVAARGKILMEAKRDGTIPEGWALDGEGRPTTDPETAIAGSVLPMAGHKGYGLAFVVALLAALLPGAAFGPEIAEPAEEWSRPGDVGHWMQVIDPSRLREQGTFEDAVDRAVDLMHASRLAPLATEVLVPGELEARTLDRQRREGIPYPHQLIEELEALGAGAGVAVPLAVP
jgi:LDH2 family malate/lactate/ureidoglycolate dehydrogenase